MEMMMNGEMRQVQMSGWFGHRCKRALSAMRCVATARIFGKASADTENALRVRERLSLGPKKMLYLVSCREKEFLVAAGAEEIVSVVEVSSSASVRSPRKAALSRMQKRELSR